MYFDLSLKFAISCLSFGLLAPFLLFDPREKFTNMVKNFSVFINKFKLNQLLKFRVIVNIL